jgi:hypothetical protein
MLVLPHLLASDPMSFFRQTKGISAWCPADQPSRAGALFKKKNVGAVCGLQPNPPTKVKLWKKGETRAFDLTRQPPAPPRRTNPVIEKQELDT